MKQVYAVILILFLSTSFAYSQNSCNYKFSVPDELARGRYQEPDMREGHPYTLFNKNTPGWTLEGALEEVRVKIISGINSNNQVEGEYALLYRDLYIYVSTVSEPGKCPFENKCPHPAWVKNNVIVYLIGLKYNAITATTGTFSVIPDSIRVQYAERAKIGLINLNPDIIPCWGGGDCGKISLKAFDLIQYLESYDLLKGSGYIGDDRNTGDCSPRNKLREFARNMHIQSEDVINSFLGWKKNHGIICASSLGLAAIVLQSAGTELNYGRFFLGWVVGKGTSWPRPNYNPQNWDKRARGTQGGYSLFGGEDGLNDLFFKGKHTLGADDVPQTNSDGTAGYAEGPGYFNYALEAFLPYVRARDNWISRTNSFLGPNETKYTNMFRWYLQILNPDGKLPPYDNSGFEIGNLLGVLGESEFQGNSEHLPMANSLNSKPYDLRGDYLLAMGGGKVQQMDVYNNAASGNLVIRNKHKEDNHSIHLLYEHDFAVDKWASRWDETHEDSDLGSIASLKINGDELLIDPGYLGWGNENYTNKRSHHNVFEFPGTFTTHNPIYASASKLSENSYLKDFNVRFPIHTFTYNSSLGAECNRNIITINTNDYVYYVINDKLNSDSITDAQIKFNGVGNMAESTCVQSGSLFRWFNHCVYKNTPIGVWQLIAHTSVLNGALNPPVYAAITDSSLSSQNISIHSNSTKTNHLTISKEGNLNGKNKIFGFHTKMVV